MTIFSRLFGRRRKDTTARGETKRGKTLLRFEPLEERRLLDCSLAYDLNVNNVTDQGTGHEDEVKLTWQDFGTGGYEIQSSVNGLDWEGSPEPWKTGLWQTIKMDSVWRRGANAHGANSVGAAGDGGINPRKYLTWASASDGVQVTRRGTLLAIAI